MQTEEAAPPTEQMRVRRDTEYVRMAQLRYVEGYHARLAELHPMKKNASGKELQQRESKWRFCEANAYAGTVNLTHARARCPGIPKGLWPAHESERWIAGYVAADEICAERGLAGARAADPSKPKRVKREALAEPIEAFPDAILTRAEADVYWDRQERIRNGHSATPAPTTVDG